MLRKDPHRFVKELNIDHCTVKQWTVLNAPLHFNEFFLHYLGSCTIRMTFFGDFFKICPQKTCMKFTLYAPEKCKYIHSIYNLHTIFLANTQLTLDLDFHLRDKTMLSP